MKYRVVDRRGGRFHPDEAMRHALDRIVLCDDDRKRPGALVERLSAADRDAIAELRSDDPSLHPPAVALGRGHFYI